MKIVLDTNVVISGIFWRGTPHKILKLVESKYIDLVQSVETFNELERVIQRGKFADITRKRELNIETILEALLTVCTFYHISERSKTIANNEAALKDPDDLKFIELAIEAEADYIVSGDPHLLEIKECNNIAILNPLEFLNVIS
jgi:putative PIN family toxin of toxin-antitoxin system